MNQPNFTYFECIRCGFDSVQHASFGGSTSCPFCSKDVNNLVALLPRVARSTDKPKFRDARIDD